MRKLIEINKSLNKAQKVIFYFVALFSILGVSINTINFNNAENIMYYKNYASIAIVVFATLIYYKNENLQKVLFAIISYTLLCNSLAGLNIPSYVEATYINIFLRESVFIVFLLTITAFISGKYNAIIIGGIYIAYTIVTTIYYNYTFLLDNIIIISILWFGFIGCIYLFIYLHDKAVDVLRNQTFIIHEQNEELRAINIQMHESQKSIAEQNECLKKANEELNESKKVKDKFFSITAHDLKNYSHAVIGFTELLRRNHRKYSKERLSEKIEILNDTALKFQKLLEELVQWSQIHTQRIVLKPKLINVHEESLFVIDSFKHMLDKKRIHLINNIRKEQTIIVDPRVYKTVLRNLLSNAIKYTHQNGNITLRSNETQNSISFSVSDSGIGMDEETSSTIFELDRHKSTNGTNNESGTGLGLQICKELIELSGGSISVTSRINRGSVFSFDFPKAS